MVIHKTHKKRRLGYKKKRLTNKKHRTTNKKHRTTNKKHRTTNKKHRKQYGGLNEVEIKKYAQDPYVQLYFAVNSYDPEYAKNFLLNSKNNDRIQETEKILKDLFSSEGYSEKDFKLVINYENGWVSLLQKIIDGGYVFFPDRWWEISTLINSEDKDFLESLIQIQELPFLSSHPEIKPTGSNFYLTDTNKALDFIKNKRNQIADPKKKTYNKRYLTINPYGKFINLFYNRFILGIPGEPISITMDKTLNVSDSDYGSDESQ